jgi:hypothetical protein
LNCDPPQGTCGARCCRSASASDRTITPLQRLDSLARMDCLILASRSGRRLELTPVRRPYAEGRGELPSWEAHVVGPGLDAKVMFNEEAWQVEFLADFLAKLAPAWRGWAGEWIWRSVEGELGLVATHNGTNTVLLAVELVDGAPARWRVDTELDFDPGALNAMGAEARRLSELALKL